MEKNTGKCLWENMCGKCQKSCAVFELSDRAYVICNLSDKNLWWRSTEPCEQDVIRYIIINK